MTNLTILALATLCVGDDVSTVSVAKIGRPIAAKVDPEGVVHLVCDAKAGPMYTRSEDGRAFSGAIPVVVVGPDTPGLEFNAWDLAIGKGGRVFVAMGTNAWKLKLPQEEWGFYLATLDPGQSAFSPVRNLNRKPSEGFSIAADDRGNVTACWLSDRLYANVSHDNGDTFGPNVEIRADYNPCNCCTTSSAYDESGRLAVLYREETNNERDMYLVLWDQARNEAVRKRVGRTPWRLDGCPMTYFTIARAKGGLLAAWPTKGEVAFARLDRDGNPTGSPEIATPGRSGMRSSLAAVPGPDGSALIAWKEGALIGWQRYDANGRPIGPSGRVEGPGPGAVGVATRDGRFILYR
ncbi:MAG: hypothetical protein U0800_25275 [Isosphaeraceae bacterium]